MKKITLLVDNFTPDLGAASFRFESIVKELADKENQINIIASYPNRIDLVNFEEFKHKNIKVIRINKRKLKENIIQRAFNYFNFFYEAIKVGIKISKSISFSFKICINGSKNI